MKTLIFIPLLLLSLLLISCEKDSKNAAETKPVQLTEKQKQLVEDANSFGFDFFRKIHSLSGNEKNLMVSPLSVSMAFGMTRNGAAGNTLEEMNNTLGMSGMSDADINESYLYILETFTSLDPRVRLSIANSIWYRNTFKVEPGFLSVNQKYFQSEVNPLDFSNAESVEIINNWVSAKTNSLIPKIIDNISEDMVMYLINAIYFKGQWKYQFDKKNTADEAFHLGDGSVAQVPFMIQETDLAYFDGDQFKAIEMPYNQGNFNMVVMLPDEGKSVSDLVANLSQDNWNSWYPQFSANAVKLRLPRFKFEYSEMRMKQAMSELGMPTAFEENNADFTRINAAGNIYISEVKHKTFIETNEEGTEAAAVTSVGMAVTSIGNDPVPIEFTCDRPFVFFIHEKTTGSILFIGTVMNPGLTD